MRRTIGPYLVGRIATSVASATASLLLAAACVTVAPSSSVLPTATLAPGATPTAAVVITLAPGQTASPAPQITVAPPTATAPTATDAPTATAPTATEPPTTPPTAEPTPSPEHPDWPVGALEPKDAADHIGEMATVCGMVNGANWLFNKPGHPTWLNLGPAYPNQRFNAVIWGEQRRQWSLNGKPEVVYLNRVICVSGMIEAYQTWTQIQDLAKADIQVIP
jgi:hypothetical protein